MQILLIDDEPEVKTFVERSLPEGSTLDYASSIVEAERFMNTVEYDEIITDLRMKNTTNGDVLIRVLELCPTVPVLVLTQLHFASYAALLIRQGATWVVFKPDAAIEPEVAERLLGESILFTKANRDARDAQLLSVSASVAAIERLEREVKELRALREHVARVEERRIVDAQDIQEIQVKLDLIAAKKTLEIAEAETKKEREKGKWSVYTKAVGGMIGAGAALLLSWAASRWK